GLLPDDRLPRPARHRRSHRVPARHRARLRGQELHAQGGDLLHRRLVLLALRRCRLDRAVPRHLLPEIRAELIPEMAREKKRRSSGRRSPFAAAALIGAGLLITGGVYAGASAAFAATETPTSASTQLTVDDGEKLFQANCATCHGMDLQGTENGPSLYGVGELSVEFQVATGRMPLQMQGPQAPQKEPQFTQEQIEAMAAYVQSVAPGPTYPEEWILTGEANPEDANDEPSVSNGAELFRINCAMCHNVAAAGGALTEGKYAPAITETSALHIYAAM